MSNKYKRYPTSAPVAPAGGGIWQIIKIINLRSIKAVAVCALVGITTWEFVIKGL